MKDNKQTEKKAVEDVAVTVSLVSIAGNIILTAFKFFAGIAAHSTAMVSDAVHSASDVISSLIVIAGVKIAHKKADNSHPYGHERFESVAAGILAAILFAVGGNIGFSAIKSIASGSYLEGGSPGVLALIAAIVSIAAKGLMFFYTRHYAQAIRSAALKAAAWDHLSDALSSIGALIGIGGAILGAAVLEPVASIVICVMILKAAFDIFREAVDQMVDKACGKETIEKIRSCILAQDGVMHIDVLQTRQFGNKIYVDTEISVHKYYSLEKGHDIAEAVHAELERTFPEIKHVMVHVNPD